MAPVSRLHCRGQGGLQSLLRATQEDSVSTNRQLGIVDQPVSEASLTAGKILKVGSFGQDPRVVSHHARRVPGLDCRSHLFPRRLQRVVERGSIVKPESGKLVSITKANLSNCRFPLVKVIGPVHGLGDRSAPPVRLGATGVIVDHQLDAARIQCVGEFANEIPLGGVPRHNAFDGLDRRRKIVG